MKRVALWGGNDFKSQNDIWAARFSPRLYKHSLLELSVISSFHLKVGGGQLESFCYFNLHAHPKFYNPYCNYFIFEIIYCT